jgi:hypothetical protein
MFGNLFKRLAPGRAVKANPACDYPVSKAILIDPAILPCYLFNILKCQAIENLVSHLYAFGLHGVFFGSRNNVCVTFHMGLSHPLFGAHAKPGAGIIDIFFSEGRNIVAFGDGIKNRISS